MATIPQGFELDKSQPLPEGFELDPQEELEGISSLEQVKEIGKEGVRQLGLTARAGIEGLAGTVGIGSNVLAVIMNQLLPKSIQFGTDLQGEVSELLTQIGVPEPENKAERIVQQISQSVAGAGAFTGISSLAAKSLPKVSQAVAKQLAGQPIQQLTGSAGAGAAQQAAAEEDMGPITQTAAGLVGGIVGSSSIGGLGSVKPNVKAMREAEKIGIKVMTSDVIPPKTATGKMVQGLTEKTFLGSGKARSVQQGQRVDAIKNIAKEYGADAIENASDDVTKRLLIKRSADIEKYSTLKNDVITRLDKTGSVPVNKTNVVIDEEIARLESVSPTSYKVIIDRLKEFKKDIISKGLVALDGNRKLLGDYFTDPNLANIRGEGEKAVRKVYSALKNDMGDFIQANGKKRDFTKWKVADTRLKGMIDELDNNALKNILKKGDNTPETVTNMLFSKKPSDVRLLYKNLPPEGRANARTAIIQKAIEKSNGIENISPAKFATQVNKLGQQIGVFFKNDDLKRVEGLAKALEITRRANEAGVATLTGYQTLPLIGGAVLQQATGSTVGAIGAASSIGMLTRAIESKQGRSLLIKIANIAETDPEPLKYAAVKRFYNLVQMQYDRKKKEAPKK